MHHILYTSDRHAALRAVFENKIRYHNGLNTPAYGYRWCERLGGTRLMDARSAALQELWLEDLIDVDTQLIQCQGYGHSVRVTHRGYVQLQSWNQQPQEVA